MLKTPRLYSKGLQPSLGYASPCVGRAPLTGYLFPTRSLAPSTAAFVSAVQTHVVGYQLPLQALTEGKKPVKLADLRCWPAFREDTI